MAAIGDGKDFENGRHLAGWLGTRGKAAFNGAVARVCSVSVAAATLTFVLYSSTELGRRFELRIVDQSGGCAGPGLSKNEEDATSPS